MFMLHAVTFPTLNATKYTEQAFMMCSFNK